jgi:trehalose 6-phosphate synthase/phosphatase
MSFTEMKRKYKSASRKLILLDYDGTLVSYAPSPEEAVPTPRLINIITRLSGQPDIRLVIITGRSRKSIEAMLGGLPVDIIAEHGAIKRINNVWKRESHVTESWKSKVIGLLDEYTANVKGSFVERKEFALTWHYRQADERIAHDAAGRLLSQLEPFAREYSLKLIDGNKIVEVVAGNSDKGIAALNLTVRDEYDFILAIGDDKTDEDMFSALSGLPCCYTIKVGKGTTFARQQLVNVQEVLLLLEQI